MPFLSTKCLRADLSVLGREGSAAPHTLMSPGRMRLSAGLAVAAARWGLARCEKAGVCNQQGRTLPGMLLYGLCTVSAAALKLVIALDRSASAASAPVFAFSPVLVLGVSSARDSPVSRPSCLTCDVIAFSVLKSKAS